MVPVRRCRALSRSTILLVGLSLIATVRRAGASDCTVPGSHSTLQAAVLDGACTTVALAEGNYSDSVVVARTVDIFGPPGGVATWNGGFLVRGDGVVVHLVDLTLDATGSSLAGCAPRALDCRDGASVRTTAVRVESGSTGSCIFLDSFESASTARWSSELP